MNQKFIAREAGVAHSTVSVVFGGKGRVSEKTREKVLAVAARYNYHPSLNQEAQRMVARRHGVTVKHKRLGVFWPLGMGMIREIMYFKMVFDGVIRACDALGLSILILNMRRDAHMDPDLVTQVDGVVSIVRQEEGVLKRLMDAGVKVCALEIDKYYPGLVYVHVDEEAVIQLAVDYLYQKGHRSMVFVGNITDVPVSHLRGRYFLEKAKSKGLEDVQLSMELVENYQPDEAVDYFERMGAQGLRKVLDLSPRPTAVLLHNDAAARGALKEAKRLGVRIPEDISIMGIDGLLEAGGEFPSLTTIDVRLQAMGRLLVERLWHRVEGGKAQDEPHEVPSEPPCVREGDTVADLNSIVEVKKVSIQSQQPT